MTRRLCLVCALCVTAASAAPEPAPAPEPPRISARSGIVMRLDPRAPQDPRGAMGLGFFRVLARDGYDAEASGWIGHAPHAAGRDDQPVSGDVDTLRLRAPMGPAWVEVGRHWSTVGGQRLTGLDGLTAGVALGDDLDVALRAGLGLPLAGAVFGEGAEVGGEARLAFDGGFVRLGLLNTTVDDGPTRTRWTAAAGHSIGWLETHGAVTADVIERAVVDARLEATGTLDDLWLRGYGRYARVDALLPPTDLLAAFAPDPRGELGAVAEWRPEARWRLRLDGAWAGMRPTDFGARWRAAVEWLPIPGAWATVEGTARVEHHGRSGLLRLAGRWPMRGTLFGTVDAMGDIEAPGDGEARVGGVARLGLGFAPWAGWLVYGALEGAQTPRWAERLGAVMVVEYALGAPVRWGGGP